MSTAIADTSPTGPPRPGRRSTAALPAPVHRLQVAARARARGSSSRAEGVYLYDSEGNRILDGMAGLWCVALGYGRRELAEAAYRQMLELPYYNSFFQTAHPPAIELAKQLADLTPPQFNRVFFTGSGSRGQRHRGAPGAPLLGPAGPAASAR